MRECLRWANHSGVVWCARGLRAAVTLKGPDWHPIRLLSRMQLPLRVRDTNVVPTTEKPPLARTSTKSSVLNALDSNGSPQTASSSVYVHGVLIDERDFEDALDFDFNESDKEMEWSSSPPENKGRQVNTRSVNAHPGEVITIASSSSPEREACKEVDEGGETRERDGTARPKELKRPSSIVTDEEASSRADTDAKRHMSNMRRDALLESFNLAPAPARRSVSTGSVPDPKRQRVASSERRQRVASGESELARPQSEEIGPKRPLRVPGIFLSEEQQRVLKLVVQEGKCVFFTGSAGTGKSVLLREIIACLRKRHAASPDRIAVTASTGLAACNIGGVTLHSFAGIGLGKDPVDALVRRVRKNKKTLQRWLRTRVLVVDELSMLDGDLFDKLEELARKLRKNPAPFGGIQLVLTGDFFQLPPVPPASGQTARFCFEAQQWKKTVPHTIMLHHVFRQRDEEFVGMLNEMRLGALSRESIARFQKLARVPDYADGLVPTELFPTRSEVDTANAARMRALQGNVRRFVATDSSRITDENVRASLFANFMAPGTLDLKENAQVMLIKNIDDQLVNGSLGRVVGFMDEQVYYTTSKESGDAEMGDDDAAKRRALAKLKPAPTGREYPLVRFVLANGCTRDMLCHPESWTVEANGEAVATRVQVPLILAYAISIHKAQGQTLDRVRVDLGRVFEKGQAYVALSRATSQAGLQVLRFDARKVQAHPRVAEFYRSLSRVEQAASTAASAPKRSPFIFPVQRDEVREQKGLKH